MKNKNLLVYGGFYLTIVLISFILISGIDTLRSDNINQNKIVLNN